MTATAAPAGRSAEASAGTELAERLRTALGDSSCRVTGRSLDLLARAHDASHYLLHPQAVAVPQDTVQVADVLRACSALGVPLTFRGGGTSLSGQALSDSVLVDARTGFQRLEVLDDGARLRVQPGVTVRSVNGHLARHRRRLGPDPASEGACTVGGVIANNSSGMQCGTELNTYRTLESMVFALPSGTVLDSADPAAGARLAAAEPELHAGLLALRDRIRGNSESVATLRRLFAIKNTMGYGMNAFLDHDDPVEILVRLLVGSEGTLGFVGSAVFRTVPVLPHAATGLLVFDGLQAASEAVPQVSAAGVATAELLDAASLRVARLDPACPQQIRRLDTDVLAAGGYAALLVELQASGPDELADRQDAARRDLSGLRLAAATELTSDAAERASLWHTRKGLYSAVAGARPSGTSALLEDVAVPVDRLGALSRGLTELFDGHGYDSSVIFGHARDGNLHFLLNERFDEPASMARYEAFTTEMVDLVLGLGGTLKAEHGTGRIMAPFVERQYGAELAEAMRQVKHLVDPQGLLNPGSVLTDDPRGYLQDLKTTPTVEPEVDRCVECGFCEPVCPSRALTTTPRQRIVLRREMAAARERGDTDLVAELERDYDYDGVQTCAVDGMCQTACPVLINTGDLVRRLRADAATPTSRRLWKAAAGHWSAVSRAGSLGLTAADKLPPAVPVTITKVGRRFAGHDTVPLYDPGLPPGGRRRRELDEAAAQAVLFDACVGSMFGGGVGDALRTLCERAGVALRTPERPNGLCCGTPWKSKGQLDGQHRMSALVRNALRTATDDGRLPVVVDASSCAQGLGQLVTGAGYRVVDALDFVADEVAPRLTVTRRVPAVVVHPTCSTTELGSTAALVRLAQLVSDDVTVPVDWGCCAFAGDRGMLHPELTASATGPEAAEVARLAARGVRTEYVSANRTCEIGMERATGQPYRHVLEVLEEATR
ncbi:oxidoreductase [Nakamurella endophytica]|uniref:D-lactate dehydrogenase (cytochrome) n=1 Tax=Nakamurella endophytica TaxID=1748367 RepID=A0A917WET7_9ACTN|nr:FAD-binding and (Fe-S)-binding domain-containing protein [Nakamurella endophytica]GGL98955.1 oxidoreductase [Nakamurella endophytica]